MRRLLVYQAIWGMENLSGIDLDSRLDEAMDQIAEAGFDGVGFSLLRAERAERVARAATLRGLSFEASAFIWNAAELAAQLDHAQALGAHHLNVQILERLGRVSDAVAFLRDLEAEAARATIPVFYETHRGRLTNDLLFLCRILDEMPDLRLTGDLSHYPVTHEMLLPVSAADVARISKVLQHCWGFHGRIPSSHQVQVSIEAPQHQAWVEQFKAWWREGFESWLRRSDPDAELTFMPELGPPYYAITDSAGHELCDRWREANLLKEIAHDIWGEVIGAKADAMAGSERAVG